MAGWHKIENFQNYFLPVCLFLATLETCEKNYRHLWFTIGAKNRVRR